MLLLSLCVSLAIAKDMGIIFDSCMQRELRICFWILWRLPHSTA